MIADLKAAGVCVVLISHRLNEVERCADRVVVLRDGRRVGELAKAEIGHAAMIRLMIGRDLKALYLPPATPPGAAVLELRGVRTAAYPGPAGRACRCAAARSWAWPGWSAPAAASSPVPCSASTGGWAARSASTGEPVAIDAPRDAIDRGIYLVPEDRKRSGLLLDVSIAENIALPDLARYARGHHRAPGAETANAERQRSRLGHQGAVGRDRGRQPVRRQPAEGRARQVAVDAPARW